VQGVRIGVRRLRQIGAPLARRSLQRTGDDEGRMARCHFHALEALELLGHGGVRLRQVRQDVQRAGQTGPPLPLAHGRKAFLLRVLRQVLLGEGEPGRAPADTHAGEAVRLPSVREGL